MWSFILTRLDGTRIAEVRNATQRSVRLALSKISTASFIVRTDNPVLSDLYGADDLLLQVWEGDELRFYGLVLVAELASEEELTGRPTVKVTAASPGLRLAKRLAGKSRGGTLYSARDKADTAKQIIDAANGEGETGIQTVAVSSGSTGTYTAGPYKPVLDCISDLANGLDGFDWYLTPLVDSEPKLVQFDAEGVFGETKGTVFEYGVGQGNVKNLRYMRDLTHVVNTAYHLPDDGLDVGTVVSARDATSISDRGLYEEVTEAFGLDDSRLRQEWVDENVLVRKIARRVVAMTLDTQDGTGRVPRLGTDFWLGDFVTARAVTNDVLMFNGRVRVYQIMVELNEAGTATVTPILLDDEGEL